MVAEGKDGSWVSQWEKNGNVGMHTGGYCEKKTGRRSCMGKRSLHVGKGNGFCRQGEWVRTWAKCKGFGRLA